MKLDITVEELTILAILYGAEKPMLPEQIEVIASRNKDFTTSSSIIGILKKSSLANFILIKEVSKITKEGKQLIDYYTFRAEGRMSFYHYITHLTSFMDRKMKDSDFIDRFEYDVLDYLNLNVDQTKTTLINYLNSFTTEKGLDFGTKIDDMIENEFIDQVSDVLVLLDKGKMHLTALRGYMSEREKTDLCPTCTSCAKGCVKSITNE